MLIREPAAVRALYAEAGRRGWVLPCFCAENLTTLEAVLAATKAYGERVGMEDLPVTLAITCRYAHRGQAAFYTHTREPDLGLRLFMADVEALAGPGSPFEKLRVMVHLDHLQYDTDAALLAGDLSAYSSVMFDASALPLEENITRTARFVAEKGGQVVIEGACDEIYDAGGADHNALTTPENAERYLRETGADMIVANLGTEHRASARDLQYESDAARAIAARTGPKIVLHGTSSVPGEQVRHLYADGVCKVNIWTALERDASPALFTALAQNAVKAAGPAAVEALIGQGLLTERAREAERADLGYFTTVYRQDIIFAEMARMVEGYLAMWYSV